MAHTSRHKRHNCYNLLKGNIDRCSSSAPLGSIVRYSKFDRRNSISHHSKFRHYGNRYCHKMPRSTDMLHLS